MSDLVLGRGKLYIGAYTGADMTTPPASLDFIGNCPELQFTVEEDVLEHRDYTEGLRTVDEEVSLELKYSGSFTTDNVTAENIAKFCGGTIVGTEIRGLASMATRYQLRFDQNNAIGTNRVYTFRKVKLSPAGAFSLIGDDWQKMQFNFKGLKDTDNYADSPYFIVDTTSTTSTTTTSTTTAG